MLTKSILKNEKRLKQCTGLTISQFNILSKRLDPLWKKAETKRLSHPNRKRTIGAGHPYTLKTISEKLFCILLWYKTYPCFWFLGMVVGLDAGNANRLVNRLRPLMEYAADPNLRNYFKKLRKERKKKKISSWEDLKREFPDIAEILIDVTEQQPKRPKKRIQRRYYSGKKKSHRLKTQVAGSLTGRILDISETYPGHTHDYTIFKKEELMKFLPPEARKWFDLAYDGIKDDFPDYKDNINIKTKRRRNKLTLTRSEKIRNHKVAKIRIKIEHIISWLKKYQILSQKYRNDFKTHYNQDFRNIAAIVNFRHGFSTQVT